MGQYTQYSWDALTRDRADLFNNTFSSCDRELRPTNDLDLRTCPRWQTSTAAILDKGHFLVRQLVSRYKHRDTHTAHRRSNWTTNNNAVCTEPRSPKKQRNLLVEMIPVYDTTGDSLISCVDTITKSTSHSCTLLWKIIRPLAITNSGKTPHR